MREGSLLDTVHWKWCAYKGLGLWTTDIQRPEAFKGLVGLEEVHASPFVCKHRTLPVWKYSKGVSITHEP